MSRTPRQAIYRMLHQTGELHIDEVPDDIDTMTNDEVWSFIDDKLPDHRAVVEQNIASTKPLLDPKPERLVQLGLHSVHILPSYDYRVLRLERMWKKSRSLEEARWRGVPPLEESDTAINVLLVLGTFMDVGRVVYDQLPAREIRGLDPVATKFLEYTVAIDVSDIESASEVYGQLRSAIRAPSPGEDIDTAPDGLARHDELGFADLLQRLFSGVRQVSFTCAQARMCRHRGCRLYVSKPAERRIIPPIPSWVGDARRSPRSIGSLLNMCFQHPPSILPREDQACGQCGEPTVPVWTIVDGPPPRLIITEPFTPTEMEWDKLHDISWSYNNPGRHSFEVAYRWYAVVFRGPDRDGGTQFWTLLNPTGSTYFSYNPRDPQPLKSVADLRWPVRNRHQVVARIYQQRDLTGTR